MPDTKSGRERNGRNKRLQLLERMNRQEIETMGSEESLPSFEGADGDFLADELPED